MTLSPTSSRTCPTSAGTSPVSTSTVPPSSGAASTNYLRGKLEGDGVVLVQAGDLKA
jgi:hypothetical protein